MKDRHVWIVFVQTIEGECGYDTVCELERLCCTLGVMFGMAGGFEEG